MYLLQDGSSVFYKIGHGYIPARKSALQTGNPEELDLVLAIPGGEPLEKFLHRVFSNRRVRGEWFEFPDRVTAASVIFRASEDYRFFKVRYPDLKASMLAELTALAKTA